MPSVTPRSYASQEARKVEGDSWLWTVSYTHLVLDSAGDTQRNIDLGMDGFTGLAHLVIGTQPTLSLIHI